MRERAERSAKMPVDDSKFDSIVDSDDEAESARRPAPPRAPVQAPVQRAPAAHSNHDDALKLRFKVGDRVLCNYQGKFRLGVITMRHYAMSLREIALPYQIRLLDGCNSLAFCRFDDDSAVRRAPPDAKPQADDEPRFKFGERVEVQYTLGGVQGVQGWYPAWVTQHWYTEKVADGTRCGAVLVEGEWLIKAPYQVRLSDREVDGGRDLIYVWQDTDVFIRKLPQQPPRPALRFGVGDAVESFFPEGGGWMAGKIKRHWWSHPAADLRMPLTEYHEGRVLLVAPYQIELDDGCLIWAPRDDDTSIRAPSRARAALLTGEAETDETSAGETGRGPPAEAQGATAHVTDTVRLLDRARIEEQSAATQAGVRTRKHAPTPPAEMALLLGENYHPTARPVSVARPAPTAPSPSLFQPTLVATPPPPLALPASGGAPRQPLPSACAPLPLPSAPPPLPLVPPQSSKPLLDYDFQPNCHYLPVTTRS